MIFCQNFSQFREKIAAVDDKGRITYGELASDIHRLGQKMGKENLHNNVCFVLCRNDIGSLCGYLGMLENRVVPLLLNADLEKTLLDNLMDIYKPAFLWIAEDKKEEGFFSEYDVLDKSHGYLLLKSKEDSCTVCHPQLGLLLTTSGSTGSPKLVRQSYLNIESNARAIAEYLEITVSERPITTLPMNYTYGLSIINSHLLKGAAVLLTKYGILQREFWDFFRKMEATSFGGVPYTYEMLHKLHFFNMDLPSLRTMTQAGGKLSPELHREFAEYAEQRGVRFFVMYGQTEATARMGYLPYEKALSKCGSMGIAIPGGRFTLIDADGSEIAESGKVGELVYEGENVALGYAVSREDLEKPDEWHKRLETGDMAGRDEEGFYYIAGRKKRFLKLFGSRVNLDEAEQMIRASFPELECACTGVDDHMKIFITETARQEDVQKFFSQKTGFNTAAFQVCTCAEIPKNDAGKVLYGNLE